MIKQAYQHPLIRGINRRMAANGKTAEKVAEFTPEKLMAMAEARTGLSDFGKMEMEIIDSNKSIQEINEMMFNITHYVIAYNVTLRDGETIGLSAEQKLKISESKGKFLGGNTLKIEF